MRGRKGVPEAPLGRRVQAGGCDEENACLTSMGPCAFKGPELPLGARRRDDLVDARTEAPGRSVDVSHPEGVKIRAGIVLTGATPPQPVAHEVQDGHDGGSEAHEEESPKRCRLAGRYRAARLLVTSCSTSFGA